MMAETSVSAAATAIKDNSGLDRDSSQELPKPHCSGHGNDSDNSCVSVNGLTHDDPLIIKENVDAAKAAVEVQNKIFDSVNGEVSGGEKGNVEGFPEDSVVDEQNTEAEVNVKVDVINVGDSSGVREISQGVEDEVIGDHLENEKENVEDQIIPESSPTPVDNQASQVGVFELVDESEEKVELGSPEASVMCQGSACVVADVAKCELQEASLVEENEVKFGRNVVETVEHEVPLQSFVVVSDLEACPINNNEKTVEGEVKINMDSEDQENQNCDTTPGTDIQDGATQAEGAKTVVSTDRHVSDLVLKEKTNDDTSVFHAKDSFQYPEETEAHNGNGTSPELMPSNSENEVSVPSQSLANSNVCKPRNGTDMSAAEIKGCVSFAPADSPISPIVENDPSGQEIKSAADDASVKPDHVLMFGTICTAIKQSFRSDDTHVESKVSGGRPEVVGSSIAAVITLDREPAEVHSSSAICGRDMTDDVPVTCRKEDVSNESASNIVLETHVKSMGDQFDGSTDENLFLRENEEVRNFQSDSTSIASQEGTNHDAVSGDNMSMNTVTKPFNYMVRVPRYNDEFLKEQIRLAWLQVGEKTKLRNDIHVQIRAIRANSRIHGINCESKKSEDRSARKLVRSKRIEIDSVQSMINKAKNAISIEDIDSRISNIEHVIQHETLPLKEEKQLIHEIKQLKRLREQLSSNMGNQAEIMEALERKEELEERLKFLRKELEILKAKVLKAEAGAAEANKKYRDEHEKIKQLQVQFRDAEVVQQEAYAHWQSLKKELWEKNILFFEYKDDATAANNYAFSRDRVALHRHCTNQVGKVMELWNKNGEFRKEYVSSNVRSTVMRFGTLASRLLGPDEKPAVLPSYVNDRVHRMVSAPTKVDFISQDPIHMLKQEIPFENGTSDDTSIKKPTEHKNQTMTTKAAAKPMLENGLAILPGQVTLEEVQEEPMKSREEIEMERKAEETRREEAEAKLKEQRRLEALAKANEARERKKRQTEKILQRAESKARKEAELKEKEREKRLRKKERKKATAVDADGSNNSNNSDSTPRSESGMETGKEIEAKDLSFTTTKKHQKPSTFMKQSKTKSIPPPLRNRNRRNWQQYAWVVATSLLVFILFWLGNIGVFSNVNLKRPSPFY